MKKEFLNIQLASLSCDSPYVDRKKALFFIHDFDFNANSFRITEELCSEINSKTGKPNYDSLNGSPIVCASDGEDLKGHEPEFDDKGNIIKLNTQSCGTLFDAHIGTHEINGVSKYGLWASGYLWLRFENTVNVIENIFNQYGSVDTSVEVLTGGYEMSEEGRTAKTTLVYTGHCLLGTKVAPAYADSGMYEFNMEVAEAYKKDLGLNNSDLDINSPVGGGNVFKFKFELNTDGSTLSYAEMRKQMNNHLRKIGKHMSLKKQMMDLNAMDVESYGQMADMMLSMMPEDAKYFDLWVPEDGMFEGYCVCSDWYNGQMFMMDWAVNGEEIEMTNPRKAKIQYVETSEVVVNSLVTKLGEFNSKIEEISSQLETKETELSTLQNEVAELQKVKSETEVKDEAIIKLNEQINSLKDEMSNLQPMINEYNQLQEEKRIAELNAQKESIKQMALKSKMITEQELCENEQIKNMVEELNEKGIKELIADRIIEANSKEVHNTELNSTDDVIVSVGEVKDLLPEDKRSKLYRPSEK